MGRSSLRIRYDRRNHCEIPGLPTRPERSPRLLPCHFGVTRLSLLTMPSPPIWGDYIFLTGNTVELGNWNTTWDGAMGPMLTPNYPNWFRNVSVPAGKTIEFKLKLDRLTCGYAYVPEPVRIIWCQHRTHRAIPRCIPVP